MSEIMPKGIRGFPKGHLSYWKGKKLPKETREKMSNTHKKIGSGKRLIHGRGDKAYNWRGGITPLKNIIRKCFEYRQWRSDIFTRDDFTCRNCKIRGGRIIADHIKAFSLILEENKIKTLEEALVCEELWNINNGRTLCQKCHEKTENFGGNSKKKYTMM